MLACDLGWLSLPVELNVLNIIQQMIGAALIVDGGIHAIDYQRRIVSVVVQVIRTVGIRHTTTQSVC